MNIRSMEKVGYKEKYGTLYKKLIVVNPRKELKIFLDSGLAKYYVAKPVREENTGKILRYERVSEYYKNFNDVREHRDFMIKDYKKGSYDYYIIDFECSDDRLVNF